MSATYEPGELCPNGCTEAVPYIGEAFSVLELDSTGDLTCFTCGWKPRRTCRMCGRDLTARQRRYCSRSCQVGGQNRDRARNQQITKGGAR